MWFTPVCYLNCVLLRKTKDSAGIKESVFKLNKYYYLSSFQNLKILSIIFNTSIFDSMWTSALKLSRRLFLDRGYLDNV